MQAVNIVTINRINPLYKNGEPAERIELVNMEEFGFDIVSQKGLYKVGDKAVFIQPDYNLSDIPLFESFIRPDGQESKSMLGKVEGKPRRIRAKKFNFSKSVGGDSVYSYGVLLPYHEVAAYVGNYSLNKLDLTDLLGITKYEEPEKSSGGVRTGYANAFPAGIYKTDETNIYNKIGQIGFPLELIGTLKVDGSSITVGVIDGKPFVGSRNMSKPFTFMKRVGRRKKTFLERLMFWKKPDLWLYEEVCNDQDDFVKYGKPVADKMLNAGLDNILLRGELNGSHLRGSGNKNNPARNEQPNIKFYTRDVVFEGVAHKETRLKLERITAYLDEQVVPVIFNKVFYSFQEIIDECNAYFKNNLVEGIVVETPDKSLSAKIMNLHYDSLK